MDKSSRPVRNRRHSRKIWLPGDNTSTHRPIKRLFTPEIKKMLKEWLVRRRENPYPTRDEKKTLAIDTGLTYTQICNWFANWRRKLKNSGREPQKTTWGSLIKSYNDNARGNVEQFSISSNDSIWSDTEMQMANNVPRSAHPKIDLKKVRRKRQPKLLANQDYGKTTTSFLDQMHLPVLGTGHPDNQFMQKFMGGPMIYDQFYKNCQRFSAQAINNLPQPQCFQVSSTTDELNLYTENHMMHLVSNEPHQPDYRSIGYFSNPNKYKNNIMEKYLRGLDEHIQVKMVDEAPINMATTPVYDANNNRELNGYAGELNGDNLVDVKPAVPELSKWLVSAANFTPSKNNYIDWDKNNRNPDKKSPKDGFDTPNSDPPIIDTSFHQKEELDAAEALTRLANNCRNKFN